MNMPKDIAELYAALPAKGSFYAKARWRISPINAIEAMVPREGQVYDIGCGVGLLSNVMAIRSDERDVIGVDLSEEKIDLAKKTVLARKNIRFERADAMNLVLHKPDVVVACDLLHHMPFSAQEVFLKRVYGSLDDNGILLIQDIDKKPLHKYLFALGVDLVLNSMEKVYYRESEKFKDLLEWIGFSVDVVRLDKGYPIAAILFRCLKNKKTS